MSVAVNGTEPTRVCLYMPFQTPVRSSAPSSDSLMATRAPLLRLQGPKRQCSGELNFELACGEILLLQSPLRHQESRTSLSDVGLGYLHRCNNCRPAEATVHRQGLRNNRDRAAARDPATRVIC